MLINMFLFQTRRTKHNLDLTQYECTSKSGQSVSYWVHDHCLDMDARCLYENVSCLMESLLVVSNQHFKLMKSRDNQSNVQLTSLLILHYEDQ